MAKASLREDQEPQLYFDRWVVIHRGREDIVYERQLHPRVSGHNQKFALQGALNIHPWLQPRGCLLNPWLLPWKLVYCEHNDERFGCAHLVWGLPCHLAPRNGIRLNWKIEASKRAQRCHWEPCKIDYFEKRWNWEWSKRSSFRDANKLKERKNGGKR